MQGYERHASEIAMNEPKVNYMLVKFLSFELWLGAMKKLIEFNNFYSTCTCMNTNDINCEVMQIDHANTKCKI